ncbi:TGF-beta-activated kinase 1 and MAP3K7-binding protein 3 [Alligator mississippiensis]|uniref:TGF-beta-activated kinase 1 and MAP3K7-binding protein 3 n=1 Tax=Alligator mississippiensis TaxID=8496 RepID=A0A151NUV1_ALLMI|nr:TGF-beta-activated kinase 1 and MAP3K7-binding protein 3 [Alligator mississippiensis]
MAQGSQQLDVQVLQDLRQRFPEIPEGVVSQCMLQNNNNLDACCRVLAQESNKYLYMEYHSPDDTRMNRNRLLHINLGIHPHTSYHAGDGTQLNGGRTLVHSSSDGHIDPQRTAGSMNKIEITVEPPQRPVTPMNRSPSPISSQPSQRNQHPLYAATTPPSGSPSRVDQEERSAAPEPIQPISVMPGSGGEKGSHKYQRSSSSGSDDYAYTQALLLHQRARMERLAKELKFEKEELERLKAEVNGMEHDLIQRRLRRVSCTTSIPTPEEMTRLRSLNRQLQINVDCTLKEVDLLQSRGNFDPKATSNFYDNIEPGPVVPPKPCKKEHQTSSKQMPRTQPRDEDFEGAPWNCDSCTFLNHPALNRCIQKN